jgi:hypothetical protein
MNAFHGVELEYMVSSDELKVQVGYGLGFLKVTFVNILKTK